MNNYSLIEVDNSIQPRGFNHVYAHTDQSLYVIDGIWGTDCEKNNLLDILREFGGELLLVTQEFPDSVLVACVSLTKRIKALEFMDTIFGTYGIIKGDGVYATGRMSTVLLKIHMKEMAIDKTVNYFMEMADRYFIDLDKIVAANYFRDNPTAISQYKKYVKKHVPWAYVHTLDIAPKGTRIRIKSLENDTGFEIFANEKMIIMIGCLGEIYEITEEKFSSTYIPSPEELNIFERFFDFIPAVELPDKGAYLTIDEKAHLCFPKMGNGIMAKQLEKRTKIFRKGTLDYFIGNPGDYMAVRGDDLQDIYIIQQEVFYKTYVEA